MKRTWTIIGVRDVPCSCTWYQTLLGLPRAAPAHDFFGQILDNDGTVLLCLHGWGDHEHPTLISPDSAQPGNGLLLFFRVDDFDAALANARALVARLEEEPHRNPNTGTSEFSVRDPDGYFVSISALPGAHPPVAGLRSNRSMPAAQVIPELTYSDVGDAIDWLCRAFGFSLRLRIGDHRAQLEFGSGAVVVRSGAPAAAASAAPHSVMVRVENVDAHYTRAVAAGAQASGVPTTYPYGERQYAAQDHAGHWWVFSQSVDDVPPEQWGGELVGTRHAITSTDEGIP